ncbi:MAG: tetratricopeptide repeat protein [Thermodesulfovibrionales bacterium]|nr:tetratricopeptide repeat protein [Thermodesulfovibrionales bacterium]
MGKDEFLDTTDKKEVRRKIKKFSISLFSVFCFLSSAFLTSCSLPRIIVLDDPLTPEEHVNLGVAYERQGKIDIAIEEYKKASKKLPIAYLYLGNVYMQRGETDMAEECYKKAIEEQPDLADAYNNLAWLYYSKKENIVEAERLVLKALEFNPSNENYKDTLKKIKELKSKNGL